MSSSTPRSRAARRPGAGFVLALLGLALLPLKAGAQCTVGTPVPFEPNPPGATRPGSLSSGFSNSLALYKNAAGAQRLLMIEAWGYSTLDLTNPGSPAALKYDDMRLDPNNSTTNQIRANGDGQNYIQTISASPDGQRVAFSVTGPAEPTWHNLVGRTDGGEGFGMWGDYGFSRAVSTAVQQVNSRYISYALYTTQNVVASDVTTLPTDNAAFQSLNLTSETTTFPPGVSLSIAGNYLVYMLLGGGVQVVDASTPGPVGSITSGYRTLQITSVPGDPYSRKPANYTAAVDPADPTKLWVLVELAASTANGENSPSYGLVSISNSGGVLQAPVSAGPLFRVPSVAGEVWGTAGNSASLVASNGQLFALMWATRFTPSLQYWVYSTTASPWSAPSGQQVSASGFGLAATSAAALAGGTTSVYQYIPTGSRAFVVPFTCQPVNAPASSSMLVTNTSAGGTAVANGGTVFAGDSLAIVPSIVPSPAAKPLASWSFDYDFHSGNAIEDAGASPRLKNSDYNQLNAGASPPASILFVGPCDPKAGGDPINNPPTCWASVTGNAAAGGPDFAPTDPPGTTKTLPIALEATNQFGIANTAVFNINWKLPAARIASTQVLSGQALTSGSDGHPTATGFKWYFGDDPTNLQLAPGCNGPTCVPTVDTKGTHAYWLTATYANGYVTPDYVPGPSATALGTYSVTDFAPAFTVNGSATGPITAVLSQNLQIVNSSQHGTGVTGAYFYSVCQIVSGGTCAAGTWLPLTGMTDPPSGGNPPTSAILTAPSAAGSYLLRIAVNYTGGQSIWPDPTGTNGFPVNVTAAVPKIRIWVNNQDPCPPGPFCIENAVNAHVGDTLKAYSYVNGVIDPGTVILNWNLPGATPTFPNGQGATFSYGAAGTYDLHLTRDGAQYDFPNAANITVKTNPLTVQASVSPNPAYVGDTVTFSCQAFGGSGGGYNYQWSAGIGVFSSSAVTTFRTTTAGTLSATCSVTDSAGASNSQSVTLNTLTGTPTPSCNTNVDFQLRDVNTNTVIQRQSNFGIEFYQVSTGQNLQFEPTGTYGSYAWTFGDGGTSASQVGSHTYAAGGQFTVSLTATPGSGQTLCNTSKTVTFQVTGPTAQFSTAYEDGATITYSSVTAFKNVVFTAYDSNVSAYSWDFGDNSAHKTDAVVTHSFVPGTFTVKLTVTKGSASASTTLALTVVPPPEPAKWVVPGMAYLAGQVPGTTWQSDVTIMNPDASHTAKYAIAFLDGRNPVDDYSKLTWSAPISVDPLKSVYARNLLADVFGQTLAAGAYGSLIVRGDLAPLPPVITARTFNNGDPAKGTFGLSVPLSATSGGVASQSSAAASVLIGLRQNDKAYTNLGLVNLKNDWPKVELYFTDASGSAHLSMTVDMMPYQSLQISNVLKAAGFAGTVDLFTCQVRILQGTAVYPYATVIDRDSTDPIVVTPSEAPSNTYRLPGIVRLTGANGERFRSRVTVSNPSANSRKIHLTFSYNPCDATGCGSKVGIEGDVNFAPGQTQSWDDFVKVWLTVKGRIPVDDATTYRNSFLDVRPADGDANVDPLVVLGETYNDTATGHVGLQIPGYTPLDGASRAGAYKRLALTGLASTASYRTNLALFVVAGASGKWLNVHVYSAQGEKLRDIPVQVDGFVQVNNDQLFGGISGDLSRLSIVVDGLDDGMTVGGYATIIDNTSGDSTFVRATPVP